jgi:hypothetical protein
MVSLVGENPLPVYMGIAQFLEKGGEATLVCSEVTEPMAKAVMSTGDRFGRYAITKLADPFDPKPTAAALGALREEMPDALLNFTGGTKVMAAYGLRAWSDQPGLAVYLDEPSRMFRFGNGVDVPLFVTGLDIGLLCRLHGVDLGKASRRPVVPYNDLAKLVREHQDLPWRGTASKPWEEWREKLSPEAQAELNRAGPARRDEYFGEKNEWFEEFVRETLLRLDGATGRIEARPGTGSLVRDEEVTSGVHFFIGGQQFESDAMAVVNTALRYVSVTTDAKEKMAKGKSFEAMHRARQIGGDMARSCVVSLAQSGTVANVRRSVNDARHRLFGVEDLLRWVAGDGQQLLDFMTD